MVSISRTLNALGSHGSRWVLKKGSWYLGSQLLYPISTRQIQRRMNEERNLEDVLDTVLDIKPGYLAYQIRAEQLRDEIGAFTSFVAEQTPTSALEIGTYHGGTFYIWSRTIESLRVMTSVDIPRVGAIDRHRETVFRSFAPETEMHFVRGNSHDESTYRAVRERIDEPVDFLFIDADHTYEGVKRDFELYSQLVSDGGIVAFHDIKPHAESREELVARKRDHGGLEDRHLAVGNPEWGVSKFWNELSDSYDTREFLTHPKQMGKGIGVVRL